MRTNLKRIACAAVGFAAVAAAAGVLPATNAGALPPGTAANGPVTLSVPSGNSGTNFIVQPPTAAACPGTGESGYRVSSYIAPDGYDIASLQWNALGAPLGGVARNLTNATGIALRNATPTIGDNFINPVTASFAHVATWSTLTPGVYNVGLVCHVPEETPPAGSGIFTIETKSFYNTRITVTAAAGAGPNNFTYSVGAVPAAPTITSVNVDGLAGTAVVNFTSASAVPAITHYTALVVNDTTGLPHLVISDPATLPAGSTSLSLTGLVLGHQYTVYLGAVNSVGQSDPVASASFDSSEIVDIDVDGPVDAFEGEDVAITWTPPTPAPPSYDVTITGPSTVTAFTGVAGTSITIPAAELVLGEYTVTVTANYALGSGLAGSGSTTLNVGPNALVYQEIEVTRPPGALVLTQRCGVYGALEPFEAVAADFGSGILGFPENLTTFGTAVASTPGIDPAPTYPVGSTTTDPLFPSYPQAGSYPTECGLDLGTASLVTSGGLAGAYYRADGRLNQVTVLDSRDTDTGWVANGDIEANFTGDAGDTFSGDFLGWEPHVTGSSVGQTVTKGGLVLPRLPGTPGGLTSNPTLASAPAGAGLGIATLDARVLLLIPTAADADDYSATLSLTVTPLPTP